MALAYNLPGALHTDSFTVGDYTYTGNSIYIDDGNGKWRIKFLSSGTFTPTKNVKVDIFAVGGGGGGSGGDSVFQSSLGSAGGGGGYTTTVKTQTLTAGTAYPIVVGSGGAGRAKATKGGSGGSSSFGSLCSANGGTGGGTATSSSTYYKAWGGDGGSGGAGSANPNVASSTEKITGGSDGSNGLNGTQDGDGQGTTTREFGESAGELYAGGGGHGGYSTYSGGTWTCGAWARGYGGAGGGGNGCDFVKTSSGSTTTTTHTGSSDSTNSQTITTRSNYNWSDVGNSTNQWKNYPSTGTSNKTLTFNFSNIPSNATISSVTLHTSVAFEGWYIGTWLMEINGTTYNNTNSSDITLTGYTFSGSSLTTPNIKIIYKGKSVTATYDDIGKSYSASNHTFTATVAYTYTTSAAPSDTVSRYYCDAEENTGGGGGGGPLANTTGLSYTGGSGGSGIVIVRNAR
jgi:hypothetical protein